MVRRALATMRHGAEVHVYEGLSFADAQPMALFRGVFPAARFPGLLEELDQTKSVTAAPQSAGVSFYTRRSTRLTAKLANATRTLHLGISEGAPILRSVGINADPGGLPIESGHSWFAADRVTLTVSEP